MTDQALAQRLDLLRTLGFADVEHDSHVPFLSHLIGTRRLLSSWRSRAALCDAGLFHSVYGTEFFELDGLEVPDRSAVRAVIGAEAEAIAHLWCTIERDTIDPDVGTVRDRRSRETRQLTTSQLEDIATLWAADTVEQVDRMSAAERSFANGLPTIIHLASRPAQAAIAPLAGLIGEY